MLEQELKKLSFYKAAKFETKGKQLLVRSSDRTTLQEKTEEYFKKNKIIYKARKKATELDVTGSSQVLVFKPLFAKAIELRLKNSFLSNKPKILFESLPSNLLSNLKNSSIRLIPIPKI